jgi:uroporphyrinogen-III decarboxylase
MTRRERLMASLRGEPVDRPPVCFYEIDGVNQDETNADPFNIFTDASWKPLLELARERSDRIVRCGVPMRDAPSDPVAELTSTERSVDANGHEHVAQTVRAGGRTLTCRTRRDPDVWTTWTVEHLLKDVDDLKAWLELPETPFGGTVVTSGVERIEADIGDSGIVMIDTGDPLCSVAPLFSMEDFTVIALTEPELFHRALEKAAHRLQPYTEAVAEALPGRLWRIYGPEYASPPYLPPHLFDEYVVRYVTPMVDAIQRHGGFARIHSHGNLRQILDGIAATGCTGLDPVEPPPQGDVSMAYVREHYGRQLALFGNLEASDLENLSTTEFRKKIRTALDEGTRGEGRGMVLMPSACPYGRNLSARALANYEAMVEMAEAWQG